MYARGGMVTMPPGPRRAITTPASAVRVSRSPPRQSSALVMARSAIRPEASMRPIPYTTSAGADGVAAGRARGSGRPAADLARCRTAWMAGEGMTGARGCAVTAASPQGAQDRLRCGRR